MSSRKNAGAERPPLKPFDPVSTKQTRTSLAESSHIVTLPSLPELYNANFLDAILPPKPTSSTQPEKPEAPIPRNAFMEALKDAGNQKLTDNLSPAFKSTLDPALDFFSAAANDSADVHDLLNKSWSANPDLTLRLIFCLRSIHDGKSEKNTFYHAFGWLYKNHPRTAIINLPSLVEPVIDRPAKKPKKAEGEEVKGSTMDESDDWEEVEKEELQLPGYSHGYYKDLLNILVLAVSKELGVSRSPFSSLSSERPWWTHENEQERKKASKAQLGSNRSDQSRPKGSRVPVTPAGERRPKPDPSNSGAALLTKRQRRAQRQSPPVTPADVKSKASQEEHDRLVTALSSPEFRALYVAVARIFAKQLTEDVTVLKQLEEGPEAAKLTDDERRTLKWKIGLVGKWAPTLGASHDRQTNISTAIAQLLYANGTMSSLKLPAEFGPETTLQAKEANTIRGYYRRWIVSPLRRFIQVPETYMGIDQWQLIKYNRVPAVCMRNSKKLFFKHDLERFQEYLADVAKGKRSIAGGTLLPNELLGEAVGLAARAKAGESGDPESQMELQVVEGQWNSLVEKLRESGALGNCMALCDVSGSMGDLGYSSGGKKFVDPIYPALALSMLVSQLAEPPFQNTFITFSESPQIVQIDPTGGLVNTAQYMVGTAWGMNTDLQAVFLELILPLAEKHKVPKEDMIKRLFIFSDMQFDECRANANNDWTTDHKAITEAYEKAGYDVPEIVYWNLSSRSGSSKPVLGDTPGTALLSGFSPNLLKIFMEGDEEELRKQLEAFAVVDEKGEVIGTAEAKSGMTPTDVMIKAVSKKSFDGLRVID